MTQGHHPEHVGLQRHSVGDIYPLAIVGVGDTWQLHNLATGDVLSHQLGGAYTNRSPAFLHAIAKTGTPATLEWRQASKAPTATRADWYGEQGTD